MNSVTQVEASKISKNKVELHVHLDGTVRISTLWELAKKKGMFPEFKTEEDFRDAFSIKSPSNLENFLKPFNLILPLISGDTEILERVAYEFCEDAAREGILYVETRYSPHLLTSPEITPRNVVVAVNEGLRKGNEDFEIKAKSILTCIRGKPDWSEEVLNLCCEFKDQGVVGIDLCGDQNAVMAIAQSDVAIFQRAAALGIHRTVHAGEDGPASQVHFSVHKLLAERIGHGYHSVDDQEVYEECLQKKIHFEVCPTSSLLTGSVKKVEQRKHPVVRFAEDCANFSISRDNPTITQKTLDEEYNLLRSFGLKDMHLAQANLNAAISAFLPENEKKLLVQQLGVMYGIKEKN